MFTREKQSKKNTLKFGANRAVDGTDEQNADDVLATKAGRANRSNMVPPVRVLGKFCWIWNKGRVEESYGQ